MDFQIQNYKPPAPRLSPELNISGIPDASPVLPDALVAQGINIFPENPQFSSFGGVSLGGERDPNGDTGSNSDEYAILINGTAPETGSGVIIPASTFTIRVNAGTYKLSGPRVKNGASVSTTLSAVTGFSGDFPVGNGYTLFIVYAKVVFAKDEDGFIDEITSASEIEVVSAEDFNEVIGWSGLEENNPQHVWQIGSVRGVKEGLQRAVFLTQTHSGPYEVKPEGNPVWSDFDQSTKTIELGGGGSAKVDKITLTNDSEVLLNIDSADFTVDEGKPIKVSRLIEVDENGVETDKGHVLASQDIDITDQSVEWAKYNGSSTAAGSLEIGGSNADAKVTDINIELEGNAKYIYINNSSNSNETKIGTADDEAEWILKATDSGGYAGLGDGALDAGTHCFQSYTFSDGYIAGFNSQGFQGTSNNGGSFSILHADLPSTASGDDQAEFREVKVCNNGVPATAHILMTKPIDD